MDKRQKVLSGLRQDGLGLEIGASFSPFVAGDLSYRVRTLDHLDREGLIAKYAGVGVDTSRILPVDYVWSGERYIELVGDTRFDWIVASHVVEHVPDLVGFFNQCAEILTPDGVLSLVVPDKRQEFDFYRPPTGLGAVIDAHAADRRVSSPGLAAEFTLSFARLNGLDCWPRRAPEYPTFEHQAWLAKANMEMAAKGEYLDIHAWVFTPHSFRLIVEDLFALGLTSLRELTFHDSEDHEFHIQLSPCGPGPGVARAELARRAVEELRLMGPPDGGSTPQPESISAPDQDVAALRNKVEALTQENAALKASTSWRLTAPLRALRRALG